MNFLPETCFTMPPFRGCSEVERVHGTPPRRPGVYAIEHGIRIGQVAPDATLPQPPVDDRPSAGLAI
jgi:hypothetical protein